MKKLLFLIIILFLSYCGNEPKEKAYLPKMKFKHTKNPNYSNYFPSATDTANQNTKKSQSEEMILSEPIPSHNSKPISNSTDNNEHSTGFFSSLFGGFGSKNKNYDENICEELLDINKTVITEQYRKLTSLKDDRKKLLDEVNNLDSNYQRQNTQNQKENQRLEKEVDRLKKLIKILSSELK